VSETAEVTSTTAEAVDETAEMTTTSEPATDPTDAVLEVAEPVTQTAGAVTETVLETAEPVTEAVAATTETVLEAAEPVTETVLASTAEAVEAVVAIPRELAGHEGDETIVLPVEDLLAGPTYAAPPLPTGGERLELVDIAPIADESFASLLAIDPSEFLPVLGAVGIATLTAAAIGRGVCSPNASLVFANVRLLPCYASATAQHMASTTASATSRVTTLGQRDGRSVPLVGGSLEKVAEGIDRVLERPREEAPDGLTDSRLLVQLGIVLGFVYLAFLTVWFWATRLRWNPRRLA
jgi:hypothetical protein